jgi:hypothetical protein
MKKELVGFLIITICCVAVAFAGDNSLWIDGISLSLGMKKEAVVDLFSKKHVLKQLEDKEYYVVMKKGESSDYSPVGQIQFANGQLSWASQTWGRFTTKDSIDLSHSLYAAIDGILGNGGKVLRVKTETRRSPEMTLSTIEFIFPNKTVELSISDGRNVEKTVVLQENLIKN